MVDNRGLSIQPAEVDDVTKQLDELVNRMQRVMETEKPNLTVVASGRDEVSQRVAQTANQVHESFTKASDQGVNEIHEAAATLRSHSGRIADADLA
jgi:methyl-accepting chemotaxis protein